MKNITKEQFAKLIKEINKKAEVTKSTYSENGRVSGWGNINMGTDYTYPRFDWSYVRKGRKIASYSSDAAEEMEVSYTEGTRKGYDELTAKNKANFNKSFIEIMPSDSYEVRSNSHQGEYFVVNIINPFFGRSSN